MNEVQMPYHIWVELLRRSTAKNTHIPAVLWPASCNTFTECNACVYNLKKTINFSIWLDLINGLFFQDNLGKPVSCQICRIAK